MVFLGAMFALSCYKNCLIESACRGVTRCQARVSKLRLRFMMRLAPPPVGSILKRRDAAQNGALLPMLRPALCYAAFYSSPIILSYSLEHERGFSDLPSAVIDNVGVCSAVRCGVPSGVDACLDLSFGRPLCFLTMGGDPVLLEPNSYHVDGDVEAALERCGFNEVFKRFKVSSKKITADVLASWENGKVSVLGLHFQITPALITEASGFKLGGQLLKRSNVNQTALLVKFLEGDETCRKLYSGIAWESLPSPWIRVAVVIMKYITLDGKYRCLFSYHLALLNMVRHQEQCDIPSFLLDSLEHSVGAIRSGSAKKLRHQGLLKLIHDLVLRQSPKPCKGLSPLISRAIILTRASPSTMKVSAETTKDSKTTDTSQETSPDSSDSSENIELVSSSDSEIKLASFLSSPWAGERCSARLKAKVVGLKQSVTASVLGSTPQVSGEATGRVGGSKGPGFEGQQAGGSRPPDHTEITIPPSSLAEINTDVKGLAKALSGAASLLVSLNTRLEGVIPSMTGSGNRKRKAA